MMRIGVVPGGRLSAMTDDHHSQALASLAGLALGDALGSQFFVPANRQALDERRLPPAPWQWTDDAEMACSVYARPRASRTRSTRTRWRTSFAEHHDFDRGYGPAVNRMLRLVREGGSWRATRRRNSSIGQGSWGNGAAMRVAPLGAWYPGDLAEAARQAALSASVTHTHPEAVAGAIAVAVAASAAAVLDARRRRAPSSTPSCRTCRPGWCGTGSVPRSACPRPPVRGEPDQPGQRRRGGTRGRGRARRRAPVSAPDTVPFTLWAAAHHLDSYEQAFWATASAGGDVDTTCAIVGGIVGARVGVDGRPASWRQACEPPPVWVREVLR